MENDLFEKEPYSDAVEKNSIKVLVSEIIKNKLPMVSENPLECEHPKEKHFIWTGMDFYVCGKCGSVIDDFIEGY